MLHDPGGLATQEPAIHKMAHYYSDSNNTSSSSSSVSPLSKLPRERKPTITTTTATANHNHRRSSDRAKDLNNLNPPQLIDLVLHLESQLDKTESRLKKYVLRCKEHVESETQASQQANKYRQKMTQVILDAQQDAARAKQDVEEYKLRYENVQNELQRSREVVQFLEHDKDEIQRALHRARDRAREYKERSAVQLAREQGRRAGFDQGLEQGRLAVQLAHARAIISALPAPTNTTSSRPAPRRRRLTQGTDGATTTPTTPTAARQRRRHSHQSQPQTRTDSVPSHHHVRRSSLDSIPELRLDGTEPTSSRSHSRPRPPSQAHTDGGRSNASQRSNTVPTAAPPPPPPPQPVQPIPILPQAQQFPAGNPRDDVSEATTSPASTMTGMDILTFREAPIVSTSPNSSPEVRRPRGGQANTTGAEDVVRHPPGRTGSHGPPPPASFAPQILHSNPSGRNVSHGPPPAASQQIPHSNPPGITIEPPPTYPMQQQQQQQPPPVVPDENLLTPTFLPSHTLPRRSSASSVVPLSTRSSFSVDINVVSPSPPSTPRESDESSSSNQDAHLLSPNGSRPISLPPAQPQRHIVQPHESPVLPILPRIVPQPTTYGTPAVRPLDLNYGTSYTSTGNDGAGAGYEEAATPPGFQYPLPLGATISSGQNAVNGKGKGTSVPPQSSAGGGSSSSFYAASPYVSKPDSSTQSVIPPVAPKTSSLSSSSTSSQQPVIPPVAPKTSSSSSSSTSSQQPVIPPVAPKTSSSSSSSSSSQQPVIPPVAPGIYQQGSRPTGNHGNGYHRNRGSDDDEEEENTSFDSATKRNTHWNSRMSRQGKWGE